MPSNVIQRTISEIWYSANDDVIFEFDFSPFAIDSVTSQGGFAKVVLLSGNFDPVPIPGEKVYISSGIYNGTHTIRTVINDTTIVLFTTFIGGVTSNVDNIYHLRVPEFGFYKGFTDLEFSPADLPFELVTTISPSILYDSNGQPYLSINVKALTARLFSPQPFTPSDTTPANIDFNIFNVVRLRWDDQETTAFDDGFIRVLYSAITNYELRLEFLQNGRYLCPTPKPILPTSGAAFFSYLEIRLGFESIVLNPGYPVVHKFIDGIRV